MRILGTALLALALIVAAACGDDDSGGGAGPDDAPITIGALLPLSGTLSSYGETSEASLKAAVEAINDKHPDQEVRLIIEDTGTDADTALENIAKLHDEGVRLVIGPYASSTVTAVKDYANQNGIVLISPLSTARSLATAGGQRNETSTWPRRGASSISAISHATSSTVGCASSEAARGASASATASASSSDGPRAAF